MLQVEIWWRRLDKKWVEEATANPAIWAMLHTATYNEHWQREGRPSPIEPFPQSESFFHAFVVMDLQRESGGRNRAT